MTPVTPLPESAPWSRTRLSRIRAASWRTCVHWTRLRLGPVCDPAIAVARLEHDPAADAAYVWLNEDREAVVMVRLPGDPMRLVDYDADGHVVGVEFLEVSRGLDLEGVPELNIIVRLADEHQLRVLM